MTIKAQISNTKISKAKISKAKISKAKASKAKASKASKAKASKAKQAKQSNKHIQTKKKIKASKANKISKTKKTKHKSKNHNYGFGIFRAKYYLGEAIDYGIPTYDNHFGTLVINATMENGRRQTVDELITELERIVNYTPIDDKTAKRKRRLAFLKIIQGSQYLSYFYSIIAYYLNGGPIDWTKINKNYEDPEPDVCVIVSGGNIVTIISNLFRMTIQGKGDLMENYLDELGLDFGDNNQIDIIKQEILNTVARNREFGLLVNELSESLPSDLDFKIVPCPIGDDAIPEDYNILNKTGELANAYDEPKNDDAALRALNHLATVANANINTPLLDMDMLEEKIETIAEDLSSKIGERPHQKIFPGPNTKNLYTQIVQQEDLERFQSNQRDLTYVKYLLNEKEIIKLNTTLNSMCMAAAFNNNNNSPPLISFMFAIHMIALRSNTQLNSQLWDADIEISPKQFNNIKELIKSGLLNCVSGLLKDMHTFPIFTTFMNKVDEIMEDNSFVIDNAGSSWSSEEISPFVDHSLFNYRDNLRITMNIIRPDYRQYGNRNVGEVTDDNNHDKSLEQQSQVDLDEAQNVTLIDNKEEETDSIEGLQIFEQ